MPEFLTQYLHTHPYIGLRDYINLSNQIYYEKENIFGPQGDFITAPFISQIFGELIGIWFLTIWQKMGKPFFNLIEYGPGEGHLMQDFLRATKKYSEFQQKMTLILYEQSAYLQKRQAALLQGFMPHWITSSSCIPPQVTFVIANEFFDAIGIEHYIKKNNNWYWRVITRKENNLIWTDIPCEKPQNDLMHQSFPDAPENSIFECQKQRCHISQEILHLIEKFGGTALYIDYGYVTPSLGDSFQAIKNHRYVDPLTSFGQADMTSHICFKDLQSSKILHYTPIIPQGDFLKNMGIMQRAHQLYQLTQKDTIYSCVHRLIHPHQMGHLFKVMAACSFAFKNLPGFVPYG